MLKAKKIKRETMLAELAKLDKKKREKISKQLQENLFGTDLWKDAHTIGIHLSTENEWDTYAIVKQAFAEGKKVAIPKTFPDTKEMLFYRIDDLSQTIQGNFGLIEPDIEKVVILEKEDIELLIVPGLVFGADGYRIGYGGGYYDRFLADYIYPTISLAHASQIVDDLPIEHFDVPVNYVVTEKGLLDSEVEKILPIWDNNYAKE